MVLVFTPSKNLRELASGMSIPPWRKAGQLTMELGSLSVYERGTRIASQGIQGTVMHSKCDL
jgi:hypothetical protein